METKCITNEEIVKLSDTDFIVRCITFSFENFSQKYDTPQKSKGECLVSSHAIIQKWYDIEQLEYIYTSFDAGYELFEKLYDRVCIDHYAVLVNDEIVIDYTLKQFFPEMESPAILSKDEWVKLFYDFWENHAFFESSKYLCTCGQGLSDEQYAECKHHWQD